MTKYWVLFRILKLRKKLGLKFSYPDAQKTLKLKQKASMMELFTQAREINIIKTKRDVKDLRTVFIIINEKKLKGEVDKAKKELLTKIKQVEGKKGKYKRLLRQLRW